MDGRQAWASISFQNSVSDSREEKKAAAKKFRQDLDRALKEEKGLKVFVAFTNVALTAGEKDALIQRARGTGLEQGDIFDRERIRIHLDSPEGLAVRYQYLAIALSNAEQATFFARWGSDLETLISRSMTSLEHRLSRIEFFAEKSRPLTYLSYYVRLSKPIPKSKLGHFRVDFLMIFKPDRRDHLMAHIGVCNERDDKQTARAVRDGQSGAVWLDRKHELISTWNGILRDPISQLIGCADHSSFELPIFDLTLGGLEGTTFVFFVNEKLAPLIEEILVVANEYLIYAAKREDLSMDVHDHKIIWPFKFSEKELEQKWIRIMSKHHRDKFDFSMNTPLRLFRAQELDLPKSNKAA